MPTPVKWERKQYILTTNPSKSLTGWHTVIRGDGYQVLQGPESPLYRASVRCEPLGEYETLIGAATA